MKIHIFYRHYNVTNPAITPSHRPQGFSYEKSFNNLLETIRGYPNVKLTVMMDGNKQGTFLEKYDVEVYEFSGGSDSASFFETVRYAKNKNIENNDLIYFLENDYLHLYGWVDKLIDLFSTYNGLSYISLYDHNDKYFLPMYENLLSKVITTKSHHWRNTPSTCGSFIIPKHIFDEDYDILSTMKGDHNKFLWLNQNRERSVITPIPGLSTHCMEGLMSPTINWNKTNK